VAASQISRSISSSEKNHGLRFEGILKIQFARKSPSKGQKPANSITSAHPISQPTQGISEFFTDDDPRLKITFSLGFSLGKFSWIGPAETRCGCGSNPKDTVVPSNAPMGGALICSTGTA
jgi:hypothetical protein